MVLSDHMIKQSDIMKTGTEGMMAEADDVMTQCASMPAMMWSDGSDPGSECASRQISYDQPLEPPDEQKPFPRGADLKTGDSVRIHGLQAAHLNGLLATVGTFVEVGDAAGRWEVMIHDGSMKAIKPEHLALMPEAELYQNWGEVVEAIGDAIADADFVVEEESPSELPDDDGARSQSEATFTP